MFASQQVLLFSRPVTFSLPSWGGGVCVYICGSEWAVLTQRHANNRLDCSPKAEVIIGFPRIKGWMELRGRSQQWGWGSGWNQPGFQDRNRNKRQAAFPRMTFPGSPSGPSPRQQRPG